MLKTLLQIDCWIKMKLFEWLKKQKEVIIIIIIIIMIKTISSAGC